MDVDPVRPDATRRLEKCGPLRSRGKTLLCNVLLKDSFLGVNAARLADVGRGRTAVGGPERVGPYLGAPESRYRCHCRA